MNRFHVPLFSFNRRGAFLTLTRLALILALLSVLALPVGALAQGEDPPPWPPPPICNEGELGLQKILTCMPADWNGILVVYAHGFVPPQQPLALPAGELGRFVDASGNNAVEAVLSLGFAFATSSYSTNGWAIEAAGADLNALVDYFASDVAPYPPLKVLLIGASEGGLVTTMQVEKHPDIYGGGLALVRCGRRRALPGEIPGRFPGGVRLFLPADL